MQASFLERIGAYFIDLIVISILASIITYALPPKNDDVSDELNTLIEDKISFEGGEQKNGRNWRKEKWNWGISKRNIW